MRKRVSLAIKSVQSKLVTIKEAMPSIEDFSFKENKGCTSEATQVCHVRDLAGVLTE